MGDLSPHFSRSEFDCRDGTKAHPDPELIRRLEALRHLCGDRPLRIVSGFRTVTYNRKVGGASNSQHLWNRAADIPPGYANLAQARAAGFTGIGYVGPHVGASPVVHVDVRPTAAVEFEDAGPRAARGGSG